jgi:hypothetical protein
MGRMAGMMQGLMNDKDKEIMAETHGSARRQRFFRTDCPAQNMGLGGGDLLGTNPFLKKK